MIPLNLNDLYKNVPMVYHMDDIEFKNDCEYGLQVFLMTLNVPADHIISDQSKEVLLSNGHVKMLITCTYKDGIYYFNIEHMFNV